MPDLTPFASDMKGRDPSSKLRADIQEYGWHCLNVWPRAGNDGQTEFSYTIGLAESYDHPEIMVFGLGERAHSILTECANLIKAGTRFVDGQPSSEVLSGGYAVTFKAVRKDCFSEYLGIAVRHYGNHAFDALVLFWPNKKHQFPWQASEPGLQAEALHVV